MSLGEDWIRAFLEDPISCRFIDGQGGVDFSKDVLVTLQDMNTLNHKKVVMFYANQPKRLSAREGYVYVIRQKNTDICKIGMTKNLESRTRFLEIAVPFEVEKLTYFSTNDTVLAERIMHGLHNEARVNGEWFHLSQDNITNIASIRFMRWMKIGEMASLLNSDYGDGRLDLEAYQFLERELGVPGT